MGKDNLKDKRIHKKEIIGGCLFYATVLLWVIVIFLIAGYAFCWAFDFDFFINGKKTIFFVVVSFLASILTLIISYNLLLSDEDKHKIRFKEAMKATK